MTQWIAFLRAINVGGHTVKMDALRQLFVAQGFNQVETFIASGNVIFEADSASLPELENRIERLLNEALGYEVKTFLRTPAELAEIARCRAFPSADLDDPAHTLYIGFLQAPPDPQAIQKLLAYANEVNLFHVHARQVYWLCRKTISQSDFSGARLEKALGMPTTMRNRTTIQKLVKKYNIQD